MSRKFGISIFIIIATFSLQQCKVTQSLAEDLSKKKTGIAGYGDLCMERDTIRSVTISKADAIITIQGDRYETKMTLFHQFDSIIYISAVSSGYEVLRGTVDKDSIKVIDRINKIVYHSPMKKRFGHQHPISFTNLENLTSVYGCCSLMQQVHGFSDNQLLFDISEDFINKKIYIGKKNFELQKFEFFHTKTNDYFVGERLEREGFQFSSNFMINDFEIKATGGEMAFNRKMKINMKVNKKKYSYIGFQ